MRQFQPPSPFLCTHTLRTQFLILDALPFFQQIRFFLISS